MGDRGLRGLALRVVAAGAVAAGIAVVVHLTAQPGPRAVGFYADSPLPAAPVPVPSSAPTSINLNQLLNSRANPAAVACAIDQQQGATRPVALPPGLTSAGTARAALGDWLAIVRRQPPDAPGWGVPLAVYWTASPVGADHVEFFAVVLETPWRVDVTRHRGGWRVTAATECD